MSEVTVHSLRGTTVWVKLFLDNASGPDVEVSYNPTWLDSVVLVLPFRLLVFQTNPSPFFQTHHQKPKAVLLKTWNYMQGGASLAISWFDLQTLVSIT